jgi:hypothetical protein
MMKIAGAFIMSAGLLYSVWIALSARNLTNPPRQSDNANSPTIEPERQGLQFFGWTRNWPALALVVIGALLMLLS